jgi:hypothetical protein
MARNQKSKQGSSATANTYTGPKTTNGKIPKITITDPKHVYGNYIKSRRPVVIITSNSNSSTTPKDLEYLLKHWSNMDYLREKASDAIVKVEPLHKEKGRYGTDAKRVGIKFGDFLDGLKEEKEEYDYLTTQYSDDDQDDDDDEHEDENDQDDQIKTSTFPQPIRSLLQKEIPLRPEIMGNLVLQQMNIWLGKSKSFKKESTQNNVDGDNGTSSGLHHDFHDNLYILLKGKKRFILYPPSAVDHVNTHGKVQKIHQNGLIVYKQPGMEEDDEEEEEEADQIRADGLVQRDAAALKVQALEEIMDEYEKNKKQKGLEKVQKEYNQAVERMMRYQTADFGELGEDDFDEVESDEEEDEDEEQVFANSKKRKADEDLSSGKDAKTAKAGGVSAQASDSNGDDDSDADLLEALEKAQNGQLDDLDDDEDDDDDNMSASDLLEAFAHAQAKDNIPSEPLSFSQIPTQELHSHLGLTSPQINSPALAKAGTPYIVELCAGDMLYLPTSWFHEVTSFSDDNDDDDIHMALNYWFHPPDAVTAPKFEQPYEDMILWKFMEGKVKSAYDELVGGGSSEKESE